MLALVLAQARFTKQTPKLRVVVGLQSYGDGVRRADQRVALTYLPGVECRVSFPPPQIAVTN